MMNGPYNYSTNSRYAINEFKPKETDLPKDTVSAIVWDRFNRNETIFFAASWDGYVRMYCLNNNNSELAKGHEYFLEHPVLCMDINPNGCLFAGLASGDVVGVNISTGQKTTVATHGAPICGVFWIQEKGALMTLGFDNLIYFWDLNNLQNKPITIELPLKTVVCNFDFPFLVIGSVETTVLVLNLKNLPNIIKPSLQDYNKGPIERFSKFMSSTVSAKTKTAVLGTIDGRSYCFEMRQIGDKIDFVNHYVARVQKLNIKNTTFHGQINSLDLGFHNHLNYLVVSGSEEICIFNVNKKSKVKSLSQIGATVGAGTAVKISPNQDYLAYSTGSDWTKGLSELDGIKKPRIMVTKLSNSDIVSFVDGK